MVNKTYCQLLLIIFLLLQISSFSQNLDIRILKSINHDTSTFKTHFFKIGANTVTIFNMAAPIGVFVAGAIKHDKQLKRDALFMAGSFILSSIVAQGTKQIVKRDRPFKEYPFIVKRSVGGGYSFPSGHTSAAFTTATSLSLLFPKWYVIVPSYLWASSVAYARMYQGVHYPSDVVVGALVGMGSAWLGYKLEKWTNKKNKKQAITLNHL